MFIVYVVFLCMIDVLLWNVFILFNYLEKDFDGVMIVFFKYVDGFKGEFIVVVKYKFFF